MDKVADYLLNPDNPQNRGKAIFFAHFGFDREDSTMLRAALMAHAVERDIVEVKETPYGRVVKLRCGLTSPDGRNPCIASVWQYDLGSDQPRLLTAI